MVDGSRLRVAITDPYGDRLSSSCCRFLIVYNLQFSFYIINHSTITTTTCGNIWSSLIRWFKEVTSSACASTTDRVTCQVCGRSRRVPPELMPNAQYFVCRDCVARAFPDLDTGHRDRRQTDHRSNPIIPEGDIESTLYDPNATERFEETRETPDDVTRYQDRLKAMERAKSQTFEIKRVTSTFFKVNTSGKVQNASGQHGSLELSDLAVDDDDGTCKICMEIPATIILLPCGHGGLCQGCAKDLVLAGKSCYICREEFTMLAEMSQKWPKSETTPATPDHELDEKAVKAEYLGRMIRPDALHHATSSARADDGRALLAASARATSGEDLNTVTSLSQPEDPDTDDSSATGSSAPETSQPRRGVSSGTLVTTDRRETAIIAL